MATQVVPESTDDTTLRLALVPWPRGAAGSPRSSRLLRTATLRSTTSRSFQAWSSTSGLWAFGGRRWPRPCSERFRFSLPPTIFGRPSRPRTNKVVWLGGDGKALELPLLAGLGVEVLVLELEDRAGDESRVEGVERPHGSHAARRTEAAPRPSRAGFLPRALRAHSTLSRCGGSWWQPKGRTREIAT